MNDNEIFIQTIYPNIIHTRFQDLLSYKKINDIDNKDLAKIFEYFTCIKLSEENSDCFKMYEDIPKDFIEERMMTYNDTGIDCSNMTNTIVQCKNWKSTLGLKDLSTFIASQNGCENGVSFVRWPKLILSVNKDCSFSDNLFNHSIKNGRLKTIKFDINKIISYCQTIQLVRYENTEQIFHLREYQREIIHCFSEDRNVIINIPTGCGKTRVMIDYINENIILDKRNKYLILVPKKCLLEQLENDINQFYPSIKHKVQYISSNSKKKELNSEQNIFIVVNNSIIELINQRIYFSDFEKIFIDEAHNIHKPNIYKSQFGDESNDDSDFSKVTYIQHIRNLTKYNNNVLLSATIDQMDGFRYISYNIRDMIEKKYISDYNVVIPVFNGYNTEYNEQDKDYTICDHLINRYRNLIIYCGNCKDGKRLNDIMNKIRPNCSNYVDCKTKRSNREKILRDFKSGKLPFVVNVEVLIEGFDASITNGVVLLHLPQSQTKIIQIIGRALRLHSEKTYAQIILPLG